MTPTTRKRADGEASSRRILDAAAEVAGERGFHGTSISAVSERSGLPASSIYWHFANKDELIAAVIERSFGQWAAALDRLGPAPAEAGADPEVLRAVMRRVGETLAEFPDFLRLGLLLILDRDPHEPTARAKFLEVRRATSDRARLLYGALFPDLGAEEVEQLTTLTLVLSDGVFIAQDADDLPRDDAYALMATALIGALTVLRAR